MAMLPIVLILAPVAGFLGMAAVLLVMTISLIEGLACAWIVMRIRKSNDPHWLWRPLAWATVSVLLFFAATILNVLLIKTCVDAGHNLFAVLFPLLISTPFSALLAVRAGFSVARLIREYGQKGITAIHDVIRGLPRRLFVIIGIVFMMCAHILIISSVSLAIVYSGDTGGIIMMICLAVFSVLLVSAAVSLWSAAKKISAA